MSRGSDYAGTPPALAQFRATESMVRSAHGHQRVGLALDMVASPETLRTRTATSSFGERTLRQARPLSARRLPTLLARLRKADGFRLLSALDGLAAAPALERPLFAPSHGACNILGSALAVSSCHVRSPLCVRTHGTGASSCLKPRARHDDDAAGRTAPATQCSAQTQLRVPLRASCPRQRRPVSLSTLSPTRAPAVR
jgi:hypothetical protein